MKAASNSVLNFHIKPWLQGLGSVSLFILIQLCIWILSWIGILKFETTDCWLYGTAMLFFYIILNSIFFFTAENKLLYYRNSIFTYLGTLVFIVMICTIISGKDVSEVETYSWILIVFSIVYIVFLTIINVLRKIVEIAIRQDKKLTDENH
ncbi:MAG: hypothetical protein IPG12_14655 [Saprospiraceae bacterium]|nr:hypothetical protein [Saprospiraceae bacterium]